MDKNGIYIHVPFCTSKCPYCDFYSIPAKCGTKAYTAAVVEEMRTLKRCGELLPHSFRKQETDTLYLGGGTPSVLSAEELTEIITTAKESFRFSSDSEITVECNPSSDNLAEKLKAMAYAGVNRVSFGMQSAVDGERKKLGRRADRNGITAAIDAARAAGIENISLDVMLGIPDQTEESLIETLDFAIATGVPHISAYMLKLEEGTFLQKNSDRYNIPDEDETADYYLEMCSRLENAGLRHYEISNFCRDDKIGRHNMKYWTLGQYLGIGPAAHSFVAGRRFYYERNLDGFIEGRPPVEDGCGGDEAERIMLGLRTDLGTRIPEKAFTFAAKLEENGLAVLDGDRIRLTDRGMLISNTIISEILSETEL